MKTILLINNEPRVRTFLRSQLSGQYLVLEVASPVEALEVCRTHSEIDLLLCDTELGLVSGMELASLLRGWIPNLRTVLTADLPCRLWQERQQVELQEIPRDAITIIQKPFTGRDLKAAIIKLVPEQIGQPA